MKVTYILRDLTDVWFAKIGAMGDEERFHYLAKQANGGDLQHCIKQKVGSGQFREKVELNQMLRHEVDWGYRLEPRKGYKLATFELRRQA